MIDRFHTAAPELFSDGMLVLHSYRHSGAKYLDAHFGRGVTRAALGHVSRNSPTDHYVEVDEDDLRAALTAYEQHLADAQAPAIASRAVAAGPA